MNLFLGNPKMLEEARNSRPGHVWYKELLIFFLVFFMAQYAETIPVSTGAFFWALSSGWSSYGNATYFSMTDAIPDWLMILSLFATAMAILIVILYCTRLERRSVPSMGLKRKNTGREYVIGAAAGILQITLAVVLSMLTGAYTLSFKGLTFSSFLVLLVWLAGYVIQGAEEEILCRGYLLNSMSRKTPVWVCILITSAVFSLMHLGNPGIGILPIINLFLSGLTFAVYFIKRGNLAGACAMHTFWNFYQGCVYGISVSGTGSVESSLFTAVQKEGMDLFTGGTFGIEGGLCVTAAEVIALLFIFFLMPVSKEEQVAEETPREEEHPAETMEEPAREVPGEPAENPSVTEEPAEDAREGFWEELPIQAAAPEEPVPPVKTVFPWETAEKTEGAPEPAGAEEPSVTKEPAPCPPRTVPEDIPDRPVDFSHPKEITPHYSDTSDWSENT